MGNLKFESKEQKEKRMKKSEVSLGTYGTPQNRSIYALCKSQKEKFKKGLVSLFEKNNG